MSPVGCVDSVVQHVVASISMLAFFNILIPYLGVNSAFPEGWPARSRPEAEAAGRAKQPVRTGLRPARGNDRDLAVAARQPVVRRDAQRSARHRPDTGA